MYDISFGRAIILLFFTGCCLVGVLKNTYTGIQKMYYIFSIVGITVYSGISTIMIGLCDDFFIPYLLFLAIFTLSYIAAIKTSFAGNGKGMTLIIKQNQSDLTDYYAIRKNSGYCIAEIIFKVSVILFLMYYFVQLIYPEVRITDLFRLHLSIDNIFERRAALRGNAVYQVFYYLNMMSLVLVFIYAYRKFRQGKWWFPILIFGIWYYLQVVTLGYSGRNDMLITLAFLLLIFDNRKNEEIIISVRLIVIGVIVVLLLVPFLNSYELTRMGASAGNEGIIQALNSLIMKESTYGRYYSFCAGFSSPIYILKYFVWLITLPLPSALFGTIKSFGLDINTLFTVAYTGIQTGSRGYSVILPSIFGEALIIYGKYFFWVHAIFLGVFIGCFCKKMEKNRDFDLLNMYFAVNMFLLGRGGSGAVIAGMVNYMVMFWIVRKIIGIKHVGE